MRGVQSYKVPDLKKKNCVRVFLSLNESQYMVFQERLTQSQEKKSHKFPERGGGRE